MKKNAFTLIELLAIIVILAIIAVITVPIILNIIENSRKGASIDSAYGYKDSVQQYYLSKSVGDTTSDVLATQQTKTVSELEADGLTVNGQKPSDGWVKINKGQVEAYSLKFGEYVVTLDETTTEPISKKNGGLAISTCPGCVFAWYPNSEMKWIKGSGQGENHPEGNNKLTDYYEDYKKLVEEKGKNYFLGHVIDDNNYIIKSYACGIENGKAFCLQSSSDGSKYSSNVDILNSIFPSCNASASSSYSHCNGTTVRAGAHLYVNTDGVYVHSGSSSCYALNIGVSHCNE